MPDTLSEIVDLLAGLRASDRRAVLNRLSRDQRQTLEKLRKPATPATEPKPPPEPTLTRGMCSSWLARHARKALQDTEGVKTTPAARDALRLTIAELSKKP